MHITQDTTIRQITVCADEEISEIDAYCFAQLELAKETGDKNLKDNPHWKHKGTARLNNNKVIVIFEAA